MRVRCKYLILLYLLVFQTGLFAQEITIDDLLGYGIKNPLFIVSCNFSGNKFDEFIVGIGTGVGKEVYGLEIIQIQDKKLISRTRIAHSGGEILEKDDFFYPIMDNNKIDLGEFYYYFYVSDYNQNGRNEIFLFQISGISFSCSIIEYHNRKVHTLLSEPLYPAYKYSFITLGEKSIEMVPQWDERIGDDLYKLKAIKYTWDENENIYKKQDTRVFKAIMAPSERLLMPFEEYEDCK